MNDKKIVLFPSKEVRSQADLLRILRDYTEDEDISQFVYERLRRLWTEEAGRTLNLHCDESAVPVVYELRNSYQELISRLFLELVNAYIDLYMATRRP